MNAGDIGVNDAEGLLCHTNNTNCCTNPGMGNWRFPDGTTLGSFFDDNGGSDDNNYFFNSRGPSVVRLNRRNNPIERGRFSCELMSDVIYVNICEY